ncbi:DNA polymerase III PolC-type-like [Entelurus aequoreus]|uniref:DNA polymerase III PolC-type-like n=1 Tax=Entelurus aequoreus TaxID=161455 RepID=UPI002B1DD1B8|nr:DNA polymerase III PolC-type-like [Entelurus aequoreus]
MSSYTVVFFDLETTGLDTQVCDIIQISAVYGKRVFNAFTVPRCDITKEAARLTGFSVTGGALFLHGEPVSTVPLWQALLSFIDFLRSFCGPVYLAAHNAARFDAPVLKRALKEFTLLEQFQSLVPFFLDTFLLSKHLFPRFPSYSQRYMVERFLDKTYNAHDATEDAKMLQELFHKLKPSRRVVMNALV